MRFELRGEGTQGKMTRILMYDVHALGGVDACFTRRQWTSVME